MKYLTLIFILLISFLEVVAQQLPDDFDYTSMYLRIPTTHVGSDFKVLKGQILDDGLRQHTPAIIGKLKNDSSHTIFTPLVPFDRDTPYTLVFNQQVFFFEIARSTDDVPLRVTGIYPNTTQVPANILKWYIEFSKPVNAVKIYDHIQFLDQDGKPINRSILNLGAPLLSSDGKLLTIWIEPGRQKRLLGPNQHLGSVFKPAHSYSLHISNKLKDAQGLPIEASVTHSFTTTDSDRVKPSIQQWQVSTLQANTAQPLDISCDEQLDYGSLLDALSISRDGKLIEGQLNYDSELNNISFTPKEHWKRGEYIIRVAYQLEDLAGNNLASLFDKVVGEGTSEKSQKATQNLSVSCD